MNAEQGSGDIGHVEASARRNSTSKRPIEEEERDVRMSDHWNRENGCGFMWWAMNAVEQPKHCEGRAKCADCFA